MKLGHPDTKNKLIMKARNLMYNQKYCFKNEWRTATNSNQIGILRESNIKISLYILFIITVYLGLNQ